MSLYSILRTALRGLAGNTLRAFLTMLGIIIGVASVITMLALGNGARAVVDANFRYLGSDKVQITVKQKFEDGEIRNIGQILSYEDGLLMPEEVLLVDSVEMSIERMSKVRYERNTIDVSVFGVTTSIFSMQTADQQLQPTGWEGNGLSPEAFLQTGRYFTPLEVFSAEAVCLLGYKTANDLFEGDDPLDQMIWVNRKPCVVVGILAELETIDPTKRAYSQPNELVLMPISTAIHYLFDEEPSVRILAAVSNESQMKESMQQITAYLRQRHQVERDQNGRYQDDFLLTTRSEILGAQQESARTFAFLLTAMAVVSLVVGGIGIMNVMLVSVTERTREVGIRMAVGATRRDILLQFLTEAVLICIIGGLLGSSIGVLSIPLMAMLNDGAALLAPVSLPLGFGFAILVGILFGLYPALRAARLDPIEALRYE